MNIEAIIRAWKADDDDQFTTALANPIGEELTDQEMLQVIGGRACCESAGSNGSSVSSCSGFETTGQV